jgi:REP element-mobilizing transposase RayT
MNENVSRPTRRSPCLAGYDYAQAGAYLVTVSVDDRSHRFGHISDHEMHPNGAGQLVEEAWLRIPDRFASVELDAYIVMPDHFHGIIFLGTDPEITPPGLSTVLQAFKSVTTIEYGRGVKAGLYP